MSDSKSKFPDLKELGSMTSKLFKDIKESVTEIIHDYKEKRTPEVQTESKAKEKKPTSKE